MKKLFSLLFLLPLLVFAQTNDGVHFEHKVTDWNVIIAQAKKENKLVFVDCYTTWCGPCKYVANNVFPLKTVGDVYNKNYVCVGLQLDQTKKDNEDVIATRAVAKKIEKDYKVEAYPTFLIFNGDGKLVHKFVGAGGEKMMIEAAQKATTKEGQYFSLLDEYNAGKKDADLIGKLCKAAMAAGEKTNEYIKSFIAVQDNLFTKENGELLMENISGSESPAFNHLFKNKSIWQTVLDKSKFDEKLKLGVFADMAEYVARQRTANVNWSEVESTFKDTYPEYYAEQLAKVKVVMNMQIEDWGEFESSLKAMIKEYPNTLSTLKNPAMLNALAWSVFENINDPALLNHALAWSKRSLEKEEETAYLDTYANLLYKLGQTKEAVDIELKAMNLAADADEKKQYLQSMEKMKKGTKTWK